VLPSVECCAIFSVSWPSFGKGEKGSLLLWYSCFDRSVLMFLMREGLQCRISILKHCLMKLWNDIISWLLFSPLLKLGQLTSVDRENVWTFEQLTMNLNCFPNLSAPDDIITDCRLALFTLRGVNRWTVISCTPESTTLSSACSHSGITYFPQTAALTALHSLLIIHLNALAIT